jgi:hypothetical protein
MLERFEEGVRLTHEHLARLGLLGG